jgi:hypothetical protein
MPHDSDLALAAHRVAQAKNFVAKQRMRIVKLKHAGCSTLNAEHTLEVFINTLELIEDYERQLRKNLSQRAASGTPPSDRTGTSCCIALDAA